MKDMSIISLLSGSGRQSRAILKRVLGLFVVILTGFVSAFDGLATTMPHEVNIETTPEGAQLYMHIDDVRNAQPAMLLSRDFLIFPVSRVDPIKYYDSLRASWIDQDFSEQAYSLIAQPGEYFVFQVGVWALKEDITDLKVRFADFTDGDGNIVSRQQMTCFNTEGTDFSGSAFVKQVDVHVDRIQSLWMGIDLDGVASGTYHGAVEVGPANEMKIVKLTLVIKGEPVANNGYDVGKGLSRMAWLNSTAGLNETQTNGFTPIERYGDRMDILGRSVTLEKSGLPKDIVSYFEPSNQFLQSEGTPVLDNPFRFIVEKQDGEEVHLTPGKLVFTAQTPSRIDWQVINTSADCDLQVDGSMEYDGFLNYNLTLTANRSLQIKDIRMDVPVKKDKAAYIMGLNHEGGERPREWHWVWDTTRNQDMLWVGAVNGGMRIKWKAENYVRPLVNIYYAFHPLRMPPSWGNEGKGGVSVVEEGSSVMVKAFSGARKMETSEQLHYDFELLLTPFKVMNKSIQYGDRYFHGGGRIADKKVDMAIEAGANIVNIHHAEDIYPFINYPYLDENRNELQQLVDAAHSKDLRLKLYYTTRELTINTPEFWAFYSLNGELIYPGPGNESVTLIHKKGPHAWLKENLREKYIPAWYNAIPEGKFKGAFDMSVITTPDSRLNNFYIGGLNWMVRNLGIDGVYIDDSALDRITLRRARKVIDRYRPQGRMDLHSWNHFNEYAGYANCLNMYMDLLPYFDLVWIGEGRDYNRMPDHWLVEVSGIPFGLPGQMLQDGGHPWRGMVYGITNRAGWGGDPTAIWNFWDEYKIEQKQMIGYWDDGSPVKVDNPQIRATLYKGDKESIIAVANWDEQVQECNINIDWEALGYDKRSCSFTLPLVQDFQNAGSLKSLKGMIVPGGKGYLVVIRDKNYNK